MNIYKKLLQVRTFDKSKNQNMKPSLGEKDICNKMDTKEFLPITNNGGTYRRYDSYVAESEILSLLGVKKHGL